MLYVTPDKYRTMGFGADLEGIEDVELASILDRASAIADDYCTVPRVGGRHSFFGGTVTAEQHDWVLPENPLETQRRRIWPYHWPLKEVTDFKIRVTNTQYVQIAPSELFINNAANYVEVVSLAFTGVGLFGALIPSIGLMRPVAEITYTYGWEFTARAEMAFATDARTYRSSNQYWDTDIFTPVVYVNGSEVPDTDYTINAVEGIVVFNSPLAATDIVSVDYDYQLPREIREGVGFLATYLLAGREIQSRGMGGLQSIKVGEVSIVAPMRRLTAESLPVLCPEAASLLADYSFITLR